MKAATVLRKNSTRLMIHQYTSLGRLFHFFLVFSFIWSFFCAFDASIPEEYKNLWVLVLVSSAFQFFAVMKYEQTGSFPLLLIIILETMKNIVSPMFLKIGNYSTYFTKISVSNIDSSIILLLYEEFVLTLFSCIMANKFKTEDKQIRSFDLINQRNYFFTVLFLLVVSGAIIIFRPSYLLNYTSIFSTNIRDIQIDLTTNDSLYTLFTVIFPIAYLSFAIFMIKICNSKMKNSIFKKLVNAVLVFIPLIFMNNSDGFTLISVLCLGFVALKSGGFSKKFFYSLFASLIVILVIYVSIFVANSSFGAENKGVFEKISDLLQAYIPGICNTSGVFNLGNVNKPLAFFYDCYFTIPFRNAIFGIQGDYRLVTFYTSINDCPSQIIPCIGQLYIYFGVFAPFIECIFLYFTFKIFNNNAHEKNMYIYFVRTMLIFYLLATPFLYNFTLFFTRYFVTIVPLYLIFKLPKFNVRT